MKNLLLALIALFLLSGCATVIKGTTQTIPVSSDPAGADVIVNNVLTGTTPTEIELKRKRDHLITIEKDGYAAASVPVLKSVGGAVWGNILAGGLIGWGVDATSGAQYNLNPETVFVRLRPTGGGGGPEEESSTVAGVARLRELDQALEEGLISDDEYGKGREEVIRRYFPEMIDEP